MQEHFRLSHAIDKLWSVLSHTGYVIDEMICEPRSCFDHDPPSHARLTPRLRFGSTYPELLRQFPLLRALGKALPRSSAFSAAAGADTDIWYV
jgi:hypothetical protein